MRRLMIVLAALLASGCQSQPANQQADAADAASKAPAPSLQLGEWEATTTILRMTMDEIVTEGATFTPDAIETPPPTTWRFCLTAERAARPYGAMVPGAADTSRCTRDGFTLANGRIGGAVQCEAAQGPTRYSFDGRYSATHYDVMTRTETHIASSELAMATGAPMTIESRTTARRTGVCEPGSASGGPP